MKLHLFLLLLFSSTSVLNAGDKASSFYMDLPVSDKTVTVRVRNVKAEYIQKLQGIREHLSSCDECKNILQGKIQDMPDSIAPDIWLCAVISNKTQTSNPFYSRPATAKP